MASYKTQTELPPFRGGGSRRNELFIHIWELEMQRIEWKTYGLWGGVLVATLVLTGGVQADHYEYRSIDGNGNNKENPDWGKADIELLRMAPAAYDDGYSSPHEASRKSPREISNIVVDQAGESIVNDRRMSDMVWQWGQFLDHDIDLTVEADPHEPYPIPVPTGDPFFDPDYTGTKTIPLSRSIYNPSTGHSSGNPRQQMNGITTWIDGSNVYGSSDAVSDALREHVDGLMKVSDSPYGDLLPEDQGGFFMAGDIRSNEQAYLTAMHTLWVREHNRIARRLKRHHNDWDDERIFQHARRQVIAHMQAITYNEFLPTLMGKRAMGRYRHYRGDINPGINNEFSTAIYRLGHTLLSSQLLRLDKHGEVIPEGNLELKDAFFNPLLIKNYGIDPYLMGLAHQPCQELDAKLVGDVRNFLFGPPGAGGFDLASLNIQRGREHGLPDYNTCRLYCGLEPVTSFDEISSDHDVQMALFEAYDGNVDKIDAWVGALCEDHLRGSSVGELIYCVMEDQFSRLRDGDRFWYEREFYGYELRLIENTRLSDIIRRNTDLEHIPNNVFIVPRGRGHGGHGHGGHGHHH